MTCEFNMIDRIKMLEDEYLCCNPNYANGGVLEVRGELQREIKYTVNNEVGYFEQFKERLENDR